MSTWRRRWAGCAVVGCWPWWWFRKDVETYTHPLKLNKSMRVGALVAVVCSLCPLLSVAIQAPVSVLSWNIHWQQGSDHIKGGREAAREALLKLAHSTNASITVAIELEANSTEPVELAWPGWTQINGSCPSVLAGKTGDALLLAVDSEQFTILKSGGGCLGGSSARGYTADARAFAVALVRPPHPVAGCPEGLCLIALHSPHINITQGAPTVSSVCGEPRSRCTVAIGDFNAPVKKRPPPISHATVEERLMQLLGNETEPLSAAAPDVNTCCYPETKYLGVSFCA
jgi:hypothetical protein